MATSDMEPSREEGVQSVIRQQLAAKEQRGQENAAWAKVREESREQLVKEEEAGREKAMKERNLVYGESYGEEFVPLKAASPLTVTAWVFAGIGVVYMVMAIFLLEKGASALTRGVLDEDFFRYAVPVVVSFAVGVGAFEFAFQFYRRGKADAEGENRGVIVGGLLFVVLAVAVLSMLVLRLNGVV